jgi:hypothetical protein
MIRARLKRKLEQKSAVPGCLVPEKKPKTLCTAACSGAGCSGEHAKARPVSPDAVKEAETKSSSANKSGDERRKDAERKFGEILAERGEKIKGPYVNNRTPVECECAKGHKCFPHPSSVIQGQGTCRICANESSSVNLAAQQEKKRKEGERKFVEIMAHRGEKIKGPYVNSHTPVECECAKGHKCNPRPDSVINKAQGICGICAGNDEEEAERACRETVRLQGGEVTGPYVNNKTPIQCICKNKHACSPTPSYLQTGGGMCRFCAPNNPEASESKFREFARLEHVTVVGPYVGAHQRVECLCAKNHVCHPVPSAVNKGGRICAACGGHKGEQRFGALLKQLTSDVTPQFCVPQIKKYWPMDFKVGNCIFEFDGNQHFNAVEAWGGEEEFNRRRIRDQDKTRGALRNNFRVVRVHYGWIRKPEPEQLQFLRATLASSEPLIVSDMERYQWLADAGFFPTLVQT